MRNPRLIVLAIVAGIAALGVAALLSFLAYAGSDRARSTLLSSYFKALASQDPAAVADLVGPDYASDLAIPKLERGAYELYEIGEHPEGTVRFILVAPGASGERKAVLGELDYARHGLVNRVESVRSIEEGRRID